MLAQAWIIAITDIARVCRYIRGIDVARRYTAILKRKIYTENFGLLLNRSVLMAWFVGGYTPDS